MAMERVGYTEALGFLLTTLRKNAGMANSVDLGIPQEQRNCSGRDVPEPQRRVDHESREAPAASMRSHTTGSPETKSLEIRRHAERNKPGPNLSQQGIEKCRKSGAARRSFKRVVTSSIPCAVQTAIAMGHAVDEEDPWLSSLGQVVSAEIDWSAGFTGFHDAIQGRDNVSMYAEMQTRLWRQILSEIGPTESVLIITHGGIIEAGVVAMVPVVDFSSWGRGLDYCEGVRMTFQYGVCTEVRLFRFHDDREIEDQVIAPLWRESELQGLGYPLGGTF